MDHRRSRTHVIVPPGSPILTHVAAHAATRTLDIDAWPARSRAATRRRPMPPSKLAHVVFQTNQIPAMREWYCAVLDGQVVYENDHLSFVTYDDEHHRVAFVDFGPLTPRDPNPELGPRATEQPGLHHTAFT